MRVSIIIAAHNEGEALWKTTRACIETCVGLDYEILIADDASVDDSVEAAQRRFPRVRVVRHEERRGASPTKDSGSRESRGDVLIFLDGHCNPEQGAITRLVQDIEETKGNAIVTPAIAGLDVPRWRNYPSQIGNGYFLDLEKFDCGWLPLSELRAVDIGRRRFYESPALIGCALAVSRDLYEELWGFDRHMRLWGVEDLDFGLKAWLMGHPILHDPQAVVGHRFRASFDNYEVPIEYTVANQLRMARKNFTHGVWGEWVDGCRMRNPGRLPDHPEGLWARVWQLFEENRDSVEQERAYLHARRTRDEFWYAQQFGLTWPRLRSRSSVPTAAPEQAAPAPGAAAPAGRRMVTFQASPSPSPPPKRRLVLLFGYWPPTDIGVDARHGMLWKWRTRQANYKGSGYDVLAITTTFPKDPIGTAPKGTTIPFWGKGTGQLIVDYRGTSKDFWSILQKEFPIAIMSFSRGQNNQQWLIERGRNLQQTDWVVSLDYVDNAGKDQTMTWDQPYAGGSDNDYSPYKGKGTIAGNPPDKTKPATTKAKTAVDDTVQRASNLPNDAIVKAVNDKFPDGQVVAALNDKATANAFVSEYMAYHAPWWRDYSKDTYKDEAVKQCLNAGHVHMGIKVAVADAETSVDLQLAELFKVLPK